MNRIEAVIRMSRGSHLELRRLLLCLLKARLIQHSHQRRRCVSPFVAHQWVLPGWIAIQRPHRHLTGLSRLATHFRVFNNHLTGIQKVGTFKNQLPTRLQKPSPTFQQRSNLPIIKMLDNMHCKDFISNRSLYLTKISNICIYIRLLTSPRRDRIDVHITRKYFVAAP